MALDVYFIMGIESNQGDGDLLHGFILIKRYYFFTCLCHDSPGQISTLIIGNITFYNTVINHINSFIK